MNRHSHRKEKLLGLKSNKGLARRPGQHRVARLQRRTLPGSALESLVAQDYADFEIIISDNASQDETETICREYAARDSRIRYYRAERNMGPVWNAVQVYQAARGEYFMLAAHDDLRHPQYLSRCVAELDRNPRALFAARA